MGYIKEPKGVDFTIESKPLTDEERKGITLFIKNYKAKQTGRKGIRKSKASTSKQEVLI